MSQQTAPTTNSVLSQRRRFGYWPRSTARRILFAGSYVGFLLALVWGASWLYVSLKIGRPLSSEAEIWNWYYPELRDSGVNEADIRPHDDDIDVLMLGGSTLNPAYGDVEGLLKSGLQRAFGERVRVFNLARISHTSRDSAIKLSRIADKPFDLIVIYDGFNDCRMNNCRPELFRDDYTHCTWYQGLEKRRRAGINKLPHELLNDLSEAIGLGAPDQNLAEYGGNLKTLGPFRHNLEEVLQIAKTHESLVVLQTFAYCIPDDYTDEKFLAGQAGYGTRKDSITCPVRMWGRQEHVEKCVTAHNRIVRELASSHPHETVFIDQQRLIAPEGRYFVDACHFTDEGCQTFVDNLLPAVVERLRARHRATTK